MGLNRLLNSDRYDPSRKVEGEYGLITGVCPDDVRNAPEEAMIPVGQAPVILCWKRRKQIGARGGEFLKTHAQKIKTYSQPHCDILSLTQSSC